MKRASTSRITSLKSEISLSSANCNSLFLNSTLFFTCADEKVPTYGVGALQARLAPQSDVWKIKLLAVFQKYA